MENGLEVSRRPKDGTADGAPGEVQAPPRGRPDPLLLFGPKPAWKSPLVIQIVSSILAIGGFILAAIWLSETMN